MSSPHEAAVQFRANLAAGRYTTLAQVKDMSNSLWRRLSPDYAVDRATFKQVTKHNLFIPRPVGEGQLLFFLNHIGMNYCRSSNFRVVLIFTRANSRIPQKLSL